MIRRLNRARQTSCFADRAALLATALAVLAATPFVLGCGSGQFELAPVSGVVTLDGSPLAGARVAFQPRRAGESPNAGPGSYGTTDRQGRFSLETIDGQQGAVVAEHDVAISTVRVAPDPSEPDPRVTVPEKVPSRYAQPDALTFTVPPSGTDAANFELTTPAAR